MAPKPGAALDTYPMELLVAQIYGAEASANIWFGGLVLAFVQVELLVDDGGGMPLVAPDAPQAHVPSSREDMVCWSVTYPWFVETQIDIR